MSKKTTGLFAARKLMERRKQFRYRKKGLYRRLSKSYKKYDPLEGAPQASGIVLEKTQVEVKQPHSGLRKCVKVQITKNNKIVTAHLPGEGAVKHVDEHDRVLIEKVGGPQGGSAGDMPGVKFKVIKVVGTSLREIVRGRKEKPVR
jgi:small subunit ribosomal protein S12